MTGLPGEQQDVAAAAQSCFAKAGVAATSNRCAVTEDQHPALRIGYLVNVYPSVSHTFIRREIAAIEARGVVIYRYSVRETSAESLADIIDRREQEQTVSLLAGGVMPLAAATLLTLILSPKRFFKAVREAIGISRVSSQGVIRHAAYVMEACRLARSVRSRRIDHIHAHYGTNPATIAMLAGVIADVPFSFTMHGSSCFDVITTIGLERKVHRAKFVVAVSKYGRSQIMRFVDPGCWDKVHVVHCGLPAAATECPIQPFPDEERLLCVARLSPEKGHSVLLEAIALLVGEGLRIAVTIVGDGPCRRRLECEVERLGIRDHVVCVGALDGDGVRQQMESSRALIIPSLMEGLPVVAMEALAAGRPVVATAVAGVPEVVRPGETGWLVAAGDPVALARAMREAVECPVEELRRLGDAGRRLMREEFLAADAAAKLHGLFVKSQASPGLTPAVPGDGDTNEAG